MPEAERVAFEKRLDAWSGYLMSVYNEVYGAIGKNLREVDPALKNTSSVQSDHAAVRYGHNFPSAHAPLDFQYQSTWNDQVGGPDYVYQWLLVDALLEMERGDKPTWISNALASAHHRAKFAGKFTRVAAHGLAFGVSGNGFAHEGFSNILGGMNKQTSWDAMKHKEGEADLVAGRQHVPMGFGRGTFDQLVALKTRSPLAAQVTWRRSSSSARPLPCRRRSMPTSRPRRPTCLCRPRLRRKRCLWSCARNPQARSQRPPSSNNGTQLFSAHVGAGW